MPVLWKRNSNMNKPRSDLARLIVSIIKMLGVEREVIEILTQK
jgi:hypothetical protein